MRIDILTLFPEMFTGVINSSIIKRAIDKGIVQVNIHNFRDYSLNKHQKVDDTPYGGGAGMVLTLQPLVDCLKAIPNYDKAYKVLTSASGALYNQKKASDLSKREHLVVICGHYEGVDERITHYIDEELSIGDYVLTGGEIPALTIIDSVIRLLPEAISEESTIEESYTSGLLEYPQYTKPAIYDGLEVPSVLVSGNHEEIRKFRRYQALKKTYLRRPDLLNNVSLTKEDLNFLELIKKDLQ
ncbi:MAG TPA: tRNA (guanosine(37)-N1)-methyltransferase TrmD [Bacilli bacterium]